MFAPSLGLTPSGPAQALSKIAPGNFVFSLFLPAFGSGVILHPCRSRPLGASLRLAPAYRKRFGDFQPDSRPLHHSSCLKEDLKRFFISLACGTGVEFPLKSASRRPDDKGWTPGMAARGESRQAVELSRPQAAGREVSAVRSTDFLRGRGD
ncbi:hypothetical protein C2U54_11890 [Leclercia sp. LSNIH1]|nr:hypothetical protein C2U54_11890 [Leclercia sp. LSNIH1]POV35264.1 hypothetical protein C3388_07530 [Leclercia sp. LSNIH5]POW67537.1 hypothetical protein C3389_06360 [Leclercia sp. LSNIH2]